MAALLPADWPWAMLVVARARGASSLPLAVWGLAAFLAHASPAASAAFAESAG